MIRSLSAATAAIFGAFFGASDLQAAGDAVRGRQITEKWCARCHAVAGARNPTAPGFSAIVRRPGRNADYLRGFLEDDHFPMVMHSLIESDKENVLAYFRSLRTKR